MWHCCLATCICAKAAGAIIAGKGPSDGPCTVVIPATACGGLPHISPYASSTQITNLIHKKKKTPHTTPHRTPRPQRKKKIDQQPKP
jgi:hypothetical protein